MQLSGFITSPLTRRSLTIEPGSVPLARAFRVLRSLIRGQYYQCFKDTFAGLLVRLSRAIRVSSSSPTYHSGVLLGECILGFLEKAMLRGLWDSNPLPSVYTAAPQMSHSSRKLSLPIYLFTNS